MDDKFEIKRAYISHSLIRSEFLSRLGVPSEYFDRNLDINTRDEIMLRSLTNIVLDSNVRLAVENWKKKDINREIISLVESARSMKYFEPTSEFPKQSEISSWLHNISLLLDNLPNIESLDQKVRYELLLHFTTSIRQVVDFLRAIDPFSEEFSRFLKRR